MYWAKIQSSYFKSILHLGQTCPVKDTRCVATSDSNVITRTTASDDSECGSKFKILLMFMYVGVSFESSCMLTWPMHAACKVLT